MSPPRRHAVVFAKYLLLQIPGWFGLGALLAAAVHWWGLSPSLALGLFAAWFAKDLLLFPVLRRAYEFDDASPADALVGARGRVSRALEPEAGGTVQLGPELWQARTSPGQGPIPAGSEVRVRAVRGLTLWVEPVGSEDLLERSED